MKAPQHPHCQITFWDGQLWSTGPSGLFCVSRQVTPVSASRVAEKSVGQVVPVASPQSCPRLSLCLLRAVRS